MVVFKSFLKEDDAGTAIEYALVASLIAVVIILALTQVGTNLSAKFQKVNTATK